MYASTRQAWSSHHQFVLWICFWYLSNPTKISTNTETVMMSMGKLSNKVSTKLSKTLEQYILYLGASWAMVCPVGMGASLAAVEGHLAPGWSCMMMTTMKIMPIIMMIIMMVIMIQSKIRVSQIFYPFSPNQTKPNQSDDDDNEDDHRPIQFKLNQR